jgi:SAM-dependent methyltransferase
MIVTVYNLLIKILMKNGVTRKHLLALARAFSRLQVEETKRRIKDIVFARTGGVVEAGPFAGLIIAEESSWGHDTVAMLLGEYEKEVTEVIAENIADYELFVDIGCADGFFAVGVARLKDIKVFAFDISEAAREHTRQRAIVNGVIDKVTISGSADAAELKSKISGKRSLILVDIEGAELDLLNDGIGSALAQSDIIVESHQVDGQPTSDVLLARFQSTHRGRVIPKQGRNPFAFPDFKDFNENEAWAALTENRGPNSHWVFFESLSAICGADMPALQSAHE